MRMISVISLVVILNSHCDAHFEEIAYREWTSGNFCRKFGLLFSLSGKTKLYSDLFTIIKYFVLKICFVFDCFFKLYSLLHSFYFLSSGLCWCSLRHVENRRKLITLSTELLWGFFLLGKRSQVVDPISNHLIIFSVVYVLRIK